MPDDRSDSVAKELKQFRLRLLDLTPRNPLLNFKPSSTKSLQIVGAVPNAVFDRLMDGRACTFIPVPDPAQTDYILQDGQREKPDAREYARQLGIDTNWELPTWSENVPAIGAEGTRLRALYYPEDLDRQCRGIARKARSAIEETGTNMLYLVFGFLEFYESEDSNRPLNAPLFAVPVNLRPGSTDPQTGLYRYELTYSGEEITENLSLREKLKQEFRIQLPELGEKDRPEDYIERIRQIISRKDRWKVKRQMTLGLMYFARMMLVRDIDPENWPRGNQSSALIEHPILQGIFVDTRDGGGRELDPYSIDDHHENGVTLELVYDADASQHSVLIDALAGKNLVVNGPPGTGKSQTITNLIAATLLRGKRVLFVSEKLAALEVVKHRLDQAGLGDFCLELHSHKTDKKRVVKDLKVRRDGRYVAPRGLDEKLEGLDRRRKRLKKYADLMNSKFGNALGLTVFEILWKAEHHRRRAHLEGGDVETLMVEEAPHMNGVQLDEMRRAIADLARHYQEIKVFGPQHPWFGFFPTSLNPGDSLRVRNLLGALIDETRKFEEAMMVLRQEACEDVPGEKTKLKAFVKCVEGLTEPGPRVITELLPRLFPPANPGVARTCENLVKDLQQLCQQASSLAQDYENKLLSPETVSEDTLNEVRNRLESLRRWNVANRTLEDLDSIVTGLRIDVTSIRRALEFFRGTAELAGQPFDGTEAAIRRTYDIMELAYKIPKDLLAFRHQGLNHSSAKEMLSRAREQFSCLNQQRHVLEDLFWLDDLPGEAELLKAIRTLRQGNAWYRFFQRDWRWACRFHKTLSRDKNAKKTASDRMEELTNLAKYLKSLMQFQKNRDYGEAFGVLFHGIETEFGKIEKLVAWYEQGRETLVRHGLSSKDLDLTSFDEFRLSQLASRMESGHTHYRVIREAAERIDDSLRGTSAYDIAGSSERPWTERLTAIETFLTEVESSLGQLKPLSPSNLTPEDILNALVARRKYTSILERIESQAELRNLLGDYFAGCNTDFQSVLETLTWGRMVAGASLPEATKAALLTCEARQRLVAIKQASSDAWEAACFDLRFADNMRRYGRFDWKQWSSVRPSVNDQDPAAAIRARAVLAAENVDGLLPWVQYNSSRGEVIKLGLKTFVEKLEAGDISSDAFEDVFCHRFYASIGHAIFASKAELRSFSGMSHKKLREEFSELDKEVIALRGKACAAGIARQASPPSGNSSPKVDEKTEMALLNHLMTLQQPRTPIRQMIRRAGRAVQALKPCFMMSPLSVAQYLEPGAVEFDLVVMDEASQLKVEEALGAIARGKQLVVAGDPNQLPPSPFFERMNTANDEQDEGTAMTPSESILDRCRSHFPSRMLRWHYRSKHESLIAFSNYYYYGNQLIVFPSPYPPSNRLGVRFHYISDGIYQSRQNHREAKRVVDAVLNHMRSRPDESLGVVTLNMTQRDLIEEMLSERLKNYEEGASYKAHWEKEGWPFFVKNLENVQGDERDVIFISPTFGPAPETKVVRQNFGPISRPLGWRRLNVLVTRARRNLHVFSSMQPEDIVIDENTPEGTRSLRNYLEYAARGVLVGLDVGDREPDSEFERVVADILRTKGYEVQPQLGVAGYFIDIAVRNPDRRGEFLAAIECDGATYHSGGSVRDRDRIRQEILESLGWKGKIWRIWSADWFRNPHRETERLLEFLNARRRAAAEETPIATEEAEGEALMCPSMTGEAASVQSVLEMAVDEDEELYIEVGDTVTYCDLETPGERKQVLITDGPSNFEQGIINAGTPLARTLLDKAEGEEVTLMLPGRGPKRLRVLRIEQNNRQRAV